MAITAQERTNIEKLVVAMYNATVDKGYLAELSASFESSGRSLAKLAQSLSGSPSFQAIHPETETGSQFTKSFLTPYGLQADAEATAFVMARYNSGMSKGEVAYEAALAINNYAGTSTAIKAAQAIQTNKATVAEYYAVTMSIQQSNVTTLQQAIASVTADPATVEAAKMQIGAGSPAFAFVEQAPPGSNHLSATLVGIADPINTAI